jgi:hypothetical protein
MSKIFRAVTKYKYSTKVDPSKRLTGQITTLIDEKSLEKLKEKIMKLNADQQEIKIVSVHWKNWWGVGS